jgi:hypothetical protein
VSDQMWIIITNAAVAVGTIAMAIMTAWNIRKQTRVHEATVQLNLYDRRRNILRWAREGFGHVQFHYVRYQSYLEVTGGLPPEPRIDPYGQPIGPQPPERTLPKDFWEEWEKSIAIDAAYVFFKDSGVTEALSKFYTAVRGWSQVDEKVADHNEFVRWFVENEGRLYKDIQRKYEHLVSCIDKHLMFYTAKKKSSCEPTHHT